jgi:hypothetical protein
MMKTPDEKIAASFGLEPNYENNIPPHITIESHPEDKQQDKDHDYGLARENIHNLLVKSNHALDNLLQLAEESPNARVYEVTAGMIKTISDTTKDLFEVHKSNTIPDQPYTQINNNTLNVTSAELLKMLKAK